MRFNLVRAPGRVLGCGSLLAVVAVLSACGPKEAPKSAPPPLVIVPPKPYPPLGAPANMTTPPLDGYGTRRTINSGLSTAQATWNLRSAYNVAALNCTKAEYAGILENYRAYLKANVKKLTATNKTVDTEFKQRMGPSFVKAREAYMTQVYNYFALPPTLPLFCDTALAVSQDLAVAKPADFDTASSNGLMRLDQVFKDFFTGYDQYRADLAAWQVRYSPTTPALSAAPAITVPQTSMPQAQ